jgi:hypothetical protein
MAASTLLDHPVIERVRTELKTNPRARWLLIAMIGLLVVGLWLRLSDHLTSVRAQLDQRSHQAARLQTIAQEAQWSERRNAAEGLRAQLEARLWSAENESLARATYVDWITATARQAGLGSVNARAEIDTGTNNPAAVKKLSASVDGTFDATAFTRFMSLIAQHNRLAVIERLHIQAVPLSRFDMNLVTYLRPGLEHPK